MGTVLPDRIKDSGIDITPERISIRRTFVVADITVDGTNAYPDPSVLYKAFTSAGIPPQFSPHPVLAYCLAKRYQITPLAHNLVEVIVTYEYDGLASGGGGSGWEFAWSTSLHGELTDTDSKGQPIEVTFSGMQVNGKDAVKVAHVTAYKPSKRLMCKRHWTVKKGEGGNPTLGYPTFIEQLQDALAGKVNKLAWRGGEPHSWMCTGCEGTTQDRGRSYAIVLTFEHRPETWDVWAKFTLANGEVPNGASKSKGIGFKRVTDLYEEVDYESILAIEPPEGTGTEAPFPPQTHPDVF